MYKKENDEKEMFINWSDDRNGIYYYNRTVGRG